MSEKLQPSPVPSQAATGATPSTEPQKTNPGVDEGWAPLLALSMDNPRNFTRPPEVRLRRIRRINTYEVLEGDLNDLDEASTDENQALAFASVCAGAFVSAVASWIGASSPTAIVFASYLAASIVLGLGTVYFGLTWIRNKKKRLRVLGRIRSQALLLEESSIQVQT